MIRLKSDFVRISSITPGMLLGLFVADQVYSEFDYECVITSANDSVHSQTSLHYSNNALDLRTRHMRPGDAELVADRIRERLNVDYDCVLESDHIHLEHQPKRR